ncbi:Muskelin [Nosema bombycis CQ1]|uniref:Muskelin n=1 Tax=Nosema bombycis (strain CQ1 / CVCC 102059) TaxID=578461 RepID=R0MRK2_NOSB1|nr:Muskelin [Nosema bombycis CQ1]|eukprot:EOB15528.1 Muskelin [Nosema bombycis CQ1]
MNGIDHIDNPYLSPTPYHNDHNHIASPGKRSCHKMVTNNSEIYLIGRYISSITRDINPVSNDIWVYKRGWYVLPSKDKNIPPNIYDHYITYGNGVLYCFGGKQTDDDETYGGLYRIEIKEDCGGEGDDEGMDRVDDEDSNDCNDSNHTLPNYDLSPTNSSTNSTNSTPSTSLNNTPSNNTTLNSSGFFHNPIERWFTLRDDLKQPSNTPQLRGRLGHTMIYIPKNHIPGNIHNNSLVIIGGQRGKENFKHIQFYSIDSDTVYETVHFPIKTEGRIIQRAHLYGEDLIVLFTFGTEKDSKLDTFCLYSYSLIKDKWKLIINVDGLIPLPRSAHQFVKFKNHFILFGGNVTDKSDKRQNDMWKLTLKRISIEEVKELLSFKIRKYKVLNLLDKGWKKIAIEFLQMKVKPLVTPKNANEFEKLCGEFFDRQDESELYEEIEKIIK